MIKALGLNQSSCLIEDRLYACLCNYSLIDILPRFVSFVCNRVGMHTCHRAQVAVRELVLSFHPVGT